MKLGAPNAILQVQHHVELHEIGVVERASVLFFDGVVQGEEFFVVKEPIVENEVLEGAVGVVDFALEAKDAGKREVIGAVAFM